MPDDELKGEFVISNEPTNTTGPGSTPSIPPRKHSIKFYSSLGLNPDNVVFENQEEDESIILLVRKDLITNVPWILAAIILILIPPLISLFSALFSPFFQISPATQFVAVIFYYLVIIGFIVVEFTIWYFNVGLVTNKRIIDLDISGILFKHVSETKLNLVEDVSYSQVGAVRSIFNYGDVLIQTAAEYKNFEFDRAPEPAKIVAIIGEMIGGSR